jgi:hypothetical protein
MNVETTVRSMLSLAGIHPSELEIQDYIAAYPATREQLQSLYAMPTLPETDGVLIFRAAE